MKGFQIVRGKLSHAVAGLAVASLLGLGLAGCGGTTELPKKAALPTGPAQLAPGSPDFPKVPPPVETTKKATGKTKVAKPAGGGAH